MRIDHCGLYPELRTFFFVEAIRVEGINAIVMLDMKQSLFFEHRDQLMVKMLGEVKLNV
jgi:hypothetical protein